MILLKFIKKVKKYSSKVLYKIPRVGCLASKPLTINDFSGYNQPYHPSVLYFDKRFGGFHYWMVQTPCPIGGSPYRDRWECPCVYYSNDGIRWGTDKKINPIDDLDSEEISNGNFFSDPHLVYRNDTQMLECWYRITHFKKDVKEEQLRYPTFIIRKKSKDGFNWGERELLIDLQDEDSLDHMIRSPSIIWDTDKRIYKMWYVDSLPSINNRRIILAESEDGISWINKTMIKMDQYIDPWHIDVNHINGKYRLINYTLTGNKGINYYESSDGMEFKFMKELLRPNMLMINSFYRAGLYRSCSVEAHDGIRVYFSASDGLKTYIGLLKGKNFEDLKIAAIPSRSNRNQGCAAGMSCGGKSGKNHKNSGD
jgi:hypothetical protein